MNKAFPSGVAYDKLSSGAFANMVVRAIRKSRYGVICRGHLYADQEPRLIEIMKQHGIHVIKLPEVYAFISGERFKVLC